MTAEDEYYEYETDQLVGTIALKINENTEVNTNTHTEVIPHNVVIDGDLCVDFQDGQGHHTFCVDSNTDTVKIDDTKIIIDPTDVRLMNGNFIVTETKIINNKPIDLNQATATNNDGLKFIFSGNNWKIYIDTNNDLVFAYNNIIVNKISHD